MMSLFGPARMPEHQIDKECRCGATLRVRTIYAALAMTALHDFAHEHSNCKLIEKQNDATSRAS